MIRPVALASLSALVGSVYAQQVGTNTAENHPALSWSKCTKTGGCTSTAASIVLDANWRWLHSTTGFTNCYTGNAWDATLCPPNDPVTCSKNCALDGADYSGTYGITTSGNSLTLKFKTGSNVGSRVYLLESESKYQMFKLKNKEFTFDVDVSNLGCGLNGALYFSEMDADGGVAKSPNNKAGAKYGTGYCDAQCPHDLKFINGEANILDWTGTSTNSGKGRYGTCCSEMDIWEANKIATAYTPHPCSATGLYRCEGSTCDVCDQPGCDFNSYRMGDTSYYGPGLKVDTSKKFTVVTQFITADGTDTGALKEIRRLYVQNGVVIQNSKVNIPGMAAYDSITEDFCSAQKTAFSDNNVFAQKGGLTQMGKAFANGMVLVMSIWDDYTANMLWLDSAYPLDKPASDPGVTRGTCATTSGVPADVESQQANASVTFSNVKFGDIGSTYTGSTPVSSSVRSSSTTRASSSTTSRPVSSSSSSRTSSRATTTSTAIGATQTHFGQCGGVSRYFSAVRLISTDINASS
ncbi:Exoglucanase 1 [Tulasnella sp. 418]|nr:Exoglucanase 1 [Tulasnella sp. 418]